MKKYTNVDHMFIQLNSVGVDDWIQINYLETKHWISLLEDEKEESKEKGEIFYPKENNVNTQVSATLYSYLLSFKRLTSLLDYLFITAN